MVSNTLIFVYGSLKEGQLNHRLLEMGGAKFVAFDCIKGDWWLADYEHFPGIVRDDAAVDVKVFGEIYEVNAECLAAVDMLEDHPHLFRREKVTTEGGISVWVYIATDAVADYASDIIEEGIWQSSDREEEYWSRNATAAV